VLQQLAPRVVKLAQGPINVLSVAAGVETLGMGGIAGLTALEPAQIAVGTFVNQTHFAVGVGGAWIHGIGPGVVIMTSAYANEFIENEPIIIPFLVRNGQAVLNTVGTQVSNCFTGVCQALWNGWTQ
jgi:hypothetical protein